YNTTLSDDDLRSQNALGLQGFATPEVWSIVVAAYNERFGSGIMTVKAEIPPASTSALSPWFLVERLAGKKWPYADLLPTRYLTFMAVMAGLYTVVNVLALVAGWLEYSGYHLYPDEARAPWLEFFNAVWAALFFVAASTRRPWAWYYLIWASLNAFLLNPLGAAIWYPSLWLYLARRRNHFGLMPWHFVM
ncbi:MAG: hypothetical protein ACREXU_10950, partial [Gammaproteobacteria bacterium]